MKRIEDRLNMDEQLLAVAILYAPGKSKEINHTYVALLRVWVELLGNNEKGLADRDEVFSSMVRLTEDLIVSYRKYLGEVKNNDPSSIFHPIDTLVQRVNVEDTLRNAEKDFFECIIETAK